MKHKGSTQKIRIGGWGSVLTKRSPSQAHRALGPTRGRRPSSTSRSTKGPQRDCVRCSASPTWAHSSSVVSTMDEMDPLLTVLESTREIAQQKYLQALEDSITNVEFSAHLTALNEKSTMSEVDDSCPQQERESTAAPPQTAQRRQRAALARFVKKIKQRAEATSARAGALHASQHGADINPAQEGWRTWNEDSQDTNSVGDERVGSKISTCSAKLINLPAWLSQRQDRTYEYIELGYSATVSSFTRSRHREQRFAQNNEAEYQKPTNSERRSAERARRGCRLKEDEEECTIIDYNEPPGGAEEAYLGPRSSARGNDTVTRGSVLGPLGPKSSAKGNDTTKPKTKRVRFLQPAGTPQRVQRESGAQSDRHQHEDKRGNARVQQKSEAQSVHQQEGSTPPTSSSRPETQPARRISGRSGTRSVDQLAVSERRAAIRSPQDVTEEEQEFLQTALEMNLPMVIQQFNPERAQYVSRYRYEMYKSGETLRARSRTSEPSGKTWFGTTLEVTSTSVRQ